MQNEMTVKTSATLSYYAGCLRAARRDLQTVENNAADYGAMYGEAMEAARDELACAEFDFECEFKACQALEELAAMEAAVPLEVPRASGRSFPVMPLHDPYEIPAPAYNPVSDDYANYCEAEAKRIEAALPEDDGAHDDDHDPTAPPRCSNPLKPTQDRCPHWKATKRVYAIAKEKNLDTTKAGKARMRHAMESALGRCVNSRGEYGFADWQAFGDMVKAGRATW